MDPPIRAFLLHVFYRHQRGKYVICVIGKLESGETFAYTDDRHPPVFYIRESDRAATPCLDKGGIVQITDSQMKTMDGESVLSIQSHDIKDHRSSVRKLTEGGIRTYEGDMNPSLNYLISQEFRASFLISGTWRPGDGIDRVYTNPELVAAHWEPQLSVLSIDIETSESADRVYSVALVGRNESLDYQTDEIHLVGEAHEDDPSHVVCHANERRLLAAIGARIQEMDPDIITGWNVIDFDLPVLAKRCRSYNLPFNLGRTRENSWYQEGKVWGGSRMVIYGRQVLDALHLVRGTMTRYEDYRLDTVAKAVLGREKTLSHETDESMADRILRAYEQDREAFIEYCLEDARLVQEILQKEGLITLTIRRCLLTGLPLERSWGSVAAFDTMYISGLHARHRVAPTLGIDQAINRGSPGGLILHPRAGLYRHVLVFDFQSLYPSIMRTFNIDPLAYIEGRKIQQSGGEKGDELIIAPNGAPFDRKLGILPEILERFFMSRAEAKNNDDSLASFAYKIIMNSCYGVLASGACRFADPDLVSAITGFGHYLLRWVESDLKERGYEVIYGDTDSLFVDPGMDDDISLSDALHFGEDLCNKANEALRTHVTDSYGVTSRLELEFEKYYRRFLLPSGRGTKDRGRAKGYAGQRVDQEGPLLEIVGMEAVRRDWTDMAHGLQRDLLAYLFADKSAIEIEELIFSWVKSVRNGEKDRELVYRKNLRKPVVEYTRNIPPHVRAAAQMPNPSGVIHYVITVNGPQPAGYVNAPLDYDHYVMKQIEPLVRTIGEFCEIDVEGSVLGKPRLF
ncbi:MAG: DNA polymerase II [Candidatus Latescibacteria bacterium]|nr:DNA polymerase II [Candidatus Latescibacterota bacterium]